MFLLLLISQFLPLVLGSVSIGKFQEYAHGLKGEVILLNERQYKIKGFHYDGMGPAVWHTGMPLGIIGVYSEKSYAFQNDKGNCNRIDKAYSNDEIVITIPKKLSLSKDIATIAVYCYQFCHNFGHVKIPKGLKLDPAPADLPENDGCKPPQPPCPKDKTRDNGVCKDASRTEVTCPVPSTTSPKSISIGKFQEYAHGLKGEVILLNERQYMIKMFNYDGLGPAVWHTGMPVGIVGVYSEKSYAFQNDKGTCDRLDKAYSNDEIVITIPKKLSLSKDIATIAVYCYQFCHNFGHVKVPKGIELPAAPDNLPENDGCKPPQPPCSKDKTRDNGVCKDKSRTEVTCPVTSAKSISIGKFQEYAHGLKGEVILLNERQYMIKMFNYDGLGPAVWHTGMPIGIVGVYSEKSYAFQNDKGTCDRLDKAYSNDEVVITIPKKLSLSKDIATIAVYCYQFCHNFGHVKVPKGIKLPPAPDNLPENDGCKPPQPPCSKGKTRDNGVCKLKSVEVTCPIPSKNSTSPAKKSKKCPWAKNSVRSSVKLGNLKTYENGVSGEVTIINTQQFKIKGFSYNGVKSNTTYFLIMEENTAGIYSVKGSAVPDENGKCDGLKAYEKKDITITLPSEINANKIGAIAVYDYEICVNFGHIKVPPGKNVPNAPKVLPKSKICLPYLRPCSRAETKNNAVCKGKEDETTC